MKRSLTIVALFGVGVLAATGYALTAHLDGSRELPMFPVTSQSIVLETTPQVMALGRVEPISRAVRIAAPTGSGAGGSAKIASLVAAEGTILRAGSVIAKLDNEPAAAAALNQAKANVEQKRTLLEKMVADLNSQESNLAAVLLQQEAERNRVKWDFEKMERLKKSGIYEDAALIDKRYALEASERRVEAARLALERNRLRDESGIRLDEATARADLAAAEAGMAKAQADHRQSIIVAPFAGRVLKIFARPGEAIGSDGLLEFADTSVMMIRAEIFESDIRFVRTGQPVTATSRSLDATLHGSVDRVGLRVSQQSVIREDPAAVLDSRVVELLVRLDEASSRLVQNLSNLQVRVSMPRAHGLEQGDNVGPVASRRRIETRGEQ